MTNHGPSTLTPEEFDYVRGLFKQQLGIPLEADKAYLVETRLLPVLRKHGFASFQDLITHLKSSPFSESHQDVLEALVTNETFFFRDRHPFDSLRDVIIPELISRRREMKQLCFWFAACSSGQEPYSVAMLIHDHFPDLAGWNLSLTATDVSEKVLARAKVAEYNKIEVSRGLPPEYLSRYFEQKNEHWCLSNSIKSMVQFKQLNLMDSYAEIPQADVVFIRNVLIYFDVETKREILSKVRKVMKPDGYLFLGGSETMINVDDSFQRVQIGEAKCYVLKT